MTATIKLFVKIPMGALCAHVKLDMKGTGATAQALRYSVFTFFNVDLLSFIL